jgi:hypothetical protein
LGPNLVGKSSVPVWHEARGQRCRGKKSGIEPNRYGDPKLCDGLTITGELVEAAKYRAQL